MTHLHTERFLLRPLLASDAADFTAAVRESAATVGKWFPWAHAGYTPDEALEWFAACDASRADGSAHTFGIFSKDGTRFLGSAGLNHFNSLHALCNLGYWVRETAHGQGAATAAATALARYAFEHLRQARVEIVVAPDNTASLAVARKCGATHECLARNRVQLHGVASAAYVFSLIPGDAAV